MLIPPDRSQEFQHIVERLQRGEIVEGFETVRIHKDGQQKHVSLTESLIKTPDGQVAGVSAIMRDISERRQFEQQLAVLTEQERQRIGRELHDTTGQELTGLGLMAQSVLEQLAAESHPGEETVRKMEESIQRALAQVRRFAQGLVPVELDASGLMAALQELATNTTEACNIPCTFHHEQPVSIDDNTMATQIYLIAKEAVANVVKHAQAEHVVIELSRYDNRVTLLVRDDGVGIGEPTDEYGMGLQIMGHRAALIQATLEIEPVDKGGTLVKCVLTT
jgi:signal transduction histidine kinase